MAEKYWVGGSGTWDNSTTTNWSNSNGGAGGASVPTSSDNANFTTSSGNGTVTIASTAACNNLVVNWTAVKTNIFSLSGNFSPSGNITINGNSAINRILIQSNTVGTSRTITANGTISITNTDFQDITAAGLADWDFNASTTIGDCGGNSNMIFPASVAQTWSGTSGGNWSTNAWTTRVPLPQDDVYLGNAFSASQTVTADMPRLGRSIDWTGATGSPTWANSVAQSMYGSLTLISGMTISGTNILTFAGRGSYSITSSGKSFTQGLTFAAPTGTYALNDALSHASSFIFNNGTFVTNGYSMSSGATTTSGSSITKVWNGSTNWTFTQVLTGILFQQYSGITGDMSGVNLIVGAASANTRTIGPIVLTTLGTLTYTVAGSTGELDITGSNSFAAINFSDASNARSLKFTTGTTTTIRNGNGFNVRGTSGKLMTIDTITGAGTFTLTSPNQQASDYMNVIRSTVGASPKWYAGANSTNGTGNTNWIFTAAVFTTSNLTKYSSEEVLNYYFGSSTTQYTLQEIANMYNGTKQHTLSFQEVLNTRAGRGGTVMSEQQALFNNVKTLLGLTGRDTQYSVQDLLNMCLQSGVPLATILG